MTRDIEILLRDRFRDIIGVYVETFPRSYSVYKSGPADFARYWTAYQEYLVENCEPIYRMAAAGIGQYLTDYLVKARGSVDEFKIIYFVGRAIERRLKHDGLTEIAKIHLFTMIGLLDRRLSWSKVEKSQLTRILTKLIRQDCFDEELGRTGCYLIYKCLSNIDKKTIE